MNRFLTTLALIFALCLPSLASAYDINPQVLLSAGKEFATSTVNKDATVGVYAHGTFFWPIKATPALFAYVGPQFNVKGHTISILTGPWFTADGGMSLMASLWYAKNLPYNLGLFMQFDAYFPMDGDGPHTDRAYYSYVVFDYEFGYDTQFKIGITQENFFTENEIQEAAIGPHLTVANFTFWPAIDFTPATPGYTFMFRLSVCL
jgi:hypothetical protein